MDAPSAALIDASLVEEIRRIERATGRTDVLSGLITTLEGNIVRFPEAFAACLAKGDNAGARQHLEHLILTWPQSALLPQARRELDLVRSEGRDV